MKLVTELNENEVIHCKTIEEWDRILELMGNPKGLRVNEYMTYKEESVLYADGLYDSVSYARNNKDKIYPASIFLAPPVSLTHTIGEYVAAQHDGKLYLFKGNQSMVLTQDIINHIKQIV